MSQFKPSDIVRQYLEIDQLTAEATRRRARVVRLAKSGKIERHTLADFLGITTSGLDQMVKAYEKNHADML